MAELDSSKVPSLSEQYLLKEKEQEPEMVAKPVEAEVKPSVDAVAEEIVQNTEETPIVADTEDGGGAAEEVVESSDVTEESKESSAGDETTNDSAPNEESNESDEPESSDNQETEEETLEIKIETAPADFRFPTTNQTRHCFTRYIEYHRCVAAKGDDAPECEKFAKYYRSLCPSEWVERWNEQRENGTFPGPL